MAGDENAFAINDLTPDLLFTYVSNKTLSDAARKQLEQIAGQKRQIAAAATGMQRLDSQISEVVRDQDRLRQNIGSLNQVSGQQQQVQAYARQLANQESQIASLRDRRAELDKKRAALESEMRNAIESMVF